MVEGYFRVEFAICDRLGNEFFAPLSNSKNVVIPLSSCGWTIIGKIYVTFK